MLASLLQEVMVNYDERGLLIGVKGSMDMIGCGQTAANEFFDCLKTSGCLTG
jgi:hypothetical protein